MTEDSAPPPTRTATDLARQARADSNPANVNRAIAMMRENPSEDPVRRATNLGAALTRRYQLTGDVDALRQSVAEQRNACEARADDPLVRSNLGLALVHWSEVTGSLDDLIEAGAHLRRAVELVADDSPRRASYLANYGLALVRLTEETGAAEPALEAVTVHRLAVEAAADPDDQAAMRANLASASMVLFRATGDRQRLRTAVDVAYEAVHTISPGHGHERGCLAVLGDVLSAAAAHDADTATSVEAVTTLRAAVHRIRASDPDGPLFLSQLAEALRGVYALTGDTQALHDSIAARRAAIDRTPADHSQLAGYQANLAMALRNRFEALYDTADLHEAKEILDEVLSAAPVQHVERAKWQGDLAHVLHRLGVSEGDLAAVAEAATLLRAIVEATGPEHRDAVMHRINLGGVLVAAAELSWDDAAYHDALATMTDALAICTTDTPQWADLHLNLGLAHAARCRQRWDPLAYDAGTAALRRALDTATAPAAIRMAGGWHLARLHELGGDAAAALDAYAAALELLDLFAWRGLLREDQERALTAYSGLGRSAAACAVGLGDPDRALALLEQGRAVLLGRVAERRSRFARLEAREPALAQELREVLDAMDGAPADLALVERQHHALRRTQVLNWIRQRPGFDRFLLPPDAGQLRAGIGDGVVVALNVAPARCDALISVAGHTSVVALPELTQDDCTDRLRDFLAAVGANTWETNDVVRSTLAWLWDVAVGPVIAALDVRDERPHVRWLPTGPLSQLPLHAAGHHDAGDDRSALERVISSYLPAMRPIVNHQVAPERETSTLVVAADAAGAPLPDVAAEAAEVASHAKPPVTSLVGPAATRSAVLANLSAATRLHVAGHAVTDPLHPSESYLQLADDVLRVREIGASHGAGGDLAYLSGCETASGGPRLADEAIHISSAFQLAGFRDVVGTLWRIPDRAARQISNAFYTAHATRPVHEALNLAIRQHREHYPTNPYEWAAFIHCGSLAL